MIYKPYDIAECAGDKVDTPISQLLQKDYLSIHEAAKICMLTPRRLMYLRTRHILSGPPFVYLPHTLRPDSSVQIWYPVKEIKWWLWEAGLSVYEVQEQIFKRYGTKMTLCKIRSRIFNLKLNGKESFPKKYVEQFLCGGADEVA